VDRPILPGGQLTGFAFSSDFLPGLATAVFVSGRAIAVSDELPLTVSSQLTPFFTERIMNRLRITVGPRLPPSTPAQEWARMFARDFRALEAVMPDLENSAFAPRILAFLDTCARDACPPDVPSPDLKTLPIEADIYSVVRLVASGSKWARYP
ncbi:MAG: hypothetical protein M3N93_06525, partial [Acidobacteriota bacterium]|nr:hypothetical protein [Acidobacteriota bacterium]